MALRFNMTAVETKRADILACSAELHRIADEIPADIRKLDAIATAMDNLDACTHAIENFGVPAVNVMNVQHQFDDIICKFNKATTSAQAIEGFMDKAKELGKEFIEWLKMIIDKIKVWIKVVIEKVRHALFDEKFASVAAKIKKAGITDEQVKERTSGGFEGNAVAGKSIIKAICDACNSLHTVNPYINQVIACKDMHSLNAALGKIYYDTATPLKHFNGRFFILTDSDEKPIDANNVSNLSEHWFITKDTSTGFNADDREQFFSDADRNDKEGIGIQEIVALENAIKACCNAFVTFSSTVEVAISRFGNEVKKIAEDGTVDQESKQVAAAIVKGLRNVTANNADLLGIITDHVIGSILDRVEKKVINDDSKCPRCGWTKTPGDTECRNCHTKFSERYEGPGSNNGSDFEIPNIPSSTVEAAKKAIAEGSKTKFADICFMLAMKLNTKDKVDSLLKFADWASAQFKKRGVDLYAVDDGKRVDPSKSDAIAYAAAGFRTNFSRERVVEFCNLVKGVSTAESSNSDIPKSTMVDIKNHDKTRVIGSIAFRISEIIQGESQDIELPMKILEEAEKEFKAAGVELYTNDSDDWFKSVLPNFTDDPTTWDKRTAQAVLSCIRHRFSRKYVELITKMFKYWRDNNGGQIPEVAPNKPKPGLTVKAKIDEFIASKDVEGARGYIVSLCSKCAILGDMEWLPFLLKAADYANKNIPGGIYEEEWALDANDDARTIVGRLERHFSRGYLSRLVYVLNRTKGG